MYESQTVKEFHDQRMYSKEEVINIISDWFRSAPNIPQSGYYSCRDYRLLKPDIEDWFNNYKKK